MPNTNTTHLLQAARKGILNSPNIVNHFKELFDKEVSTRFLQNVFPCKSSAPLLVEMGVNLYNMGFEVSLNERKELTQI